MPEILLVVNAYQEGHRACKIYCFATDKKQPRKFWQTQPSNTWQAQNNDVGIGRILRGWIYIDAPSIKC